MAIRFPGFFRPHTAFEQQHTELFTAIDEIAERVRALGSLAPGGLGNLATMAGMKELGEDPSAEAMVRHLADMNRQLVADLGKARDQAGEGGLGERGPDDRPDPGAREDDLDAGESPAAGGNRGVRGKFHEIW